MTIAQLRQRIMKHRCGRRATSLTVCSLPHSNRLQDVLGDEGAVFASSRQSLGVSAAFLTPQMWLERRHSGGGGPSQHPGQMVCRWAVPKRTNEHTRVATKQANK